MLYRLKTLFIKLNDVHNRDRKRDIISVQDISILDDIRYFENVEA